MMKIYHANLPYQLEGFALSSLDNTSKMSIVNFDRDYFPIPWNQAAWEMVWRGERSFILFLYMDLDEILGLALYSIEDQGDNHFLAHLLKIAISPRVRFRGIGRTLIEGLKLAKVQIPQQIYLEVEEDNVGAIHFYNACGLKYIHVKKNYYSDGRHALVFMGNI